jgi:thioredoxin reductase (NADPH)
MIEGKETRRPADLTTLVENYPGFADGIMGPQLDGRYAKAGAAFGTEIVSGFVHK